MFTDIEGSTGLLKRLGRARYGELLAAQQRLLREAFVAHHGAEVDTQGDSFFVAFRSASDAVSAAVAIQRALSGHAWPDGVEVRVRIGIHSGEAASTGDRYVGVSVHRAARIGSAAHGGQVLLSDSTRSLVEDDLPEGVELRDLGLMRLKDIDRPERISQVTADGLRPEFPPLKAERVRERPRVRRRTILVGAFAGALAAAVAIPIFALSGGSGGSTALASVDANALGLVDPATGRISGEIPVGATPTHVAVGEGAIWVSNTDSNSVSRIDPRKQLVVQTIPVGSSPSGIVTGNGAVWVANSLDGTVSRIDPATNTVVQRIPVGNGPAGVAFAAGSIWVANTGDETITRIDAGSGNAGKPLPIAATELAVRRRLAVGERQHRKPGRSDRSDHGQRRAGVIPVGNGPTGIAFGSGSAWVVNSLDGTVSRIDPETNSVTALDHNGKRPRRGRGRCPRCLGEQPVRRHARANRPTHEPT